MDTGLVFIEILTVCEKIIGHCINISVSTRNYMSYDDYITKREYFDTMYAKDVELLNEKLEEFTDKYELLSMDNKLNMV